MNLKQDKISNKNKPTNKGSSLNLGVKKNDECYTSMQDILNELGYWAELGKFQGKNIICPCDWDIVAEENIYSIQIKYNDSEIDVNGNVINKSESVIYDMWDEVQDTSIKLQLKEDEIQDFLRNKLTCNFVRTLVQNARRWGVKSITASGYNPANGKGTPFQDIDYTKYDICITNPPFSLYSDFMSCIVGKIEFIILAPFMNRVAPCIGLYLMTKDAYIGTSGNSDKGYLALNFLNPNSENKYNTKKVACDWIVSYEEAQIERNNKHWKSGVQYNIYKDEYLEMTGMTMKDGTHPIKVPSDAYPEDYEGWMFAGINVLTRLDNTYEWYGTNFMKYYKQHNEVSPFNHPTTNEMIKDSNGKQGFHGIVFRKKPQAKEN